MVDMNVNIGSMHMKNPVTVASGTFGSGLQYSEFFDISLLGAVTTKGVSLQGWQGNESPRVCETPSGMLNSIGLQNPGVEHLKSLDLKELENVDTNVIVNVSGHSIDEYVLVIESLEQSCVDAYELNVSCPNVDSGGMALGTDPKLVAEVTRRCRRATKRPLIVKLTPNVTDIVEIALSAQSEGADAVSLINTVLGMAVDVRKRRACLARVVGGLSGPAVKPIALRMVWQCYSALDIPIIGMGGISNASDALEFILCGASAVAVGSANFKNPLAALEVVRGIEKYCEEEGINSVSTLKGALLC